MDALQLLEPFGMENPPPIFLSRCQTDPSPKIVGKVHLKIFLEQNGRFLEGIGFGMASRRDSLLKKDLHLRTCLFSQNQYLP